MELTKIPGLEGLYFEQGVWKGYAWLTQIEHREIVKVLPLLGEYQHPFDGTRKILNPLKEMQVEFCKGTNGEQTFQLAAIPQEFMAGLELDTEIENDPLEDAVVSALKRLMEEAT